MARATRQSPERQELIVRLAGENAACTTCTSERHDSTSSDRWGRSGAIASRQPGMRAPRARRIVTSRHVYDPSAEFLHGGFARPIGRLRFRDLEGDDVWTSRREADQLDLSIRRGFLAGRG